MRLVGVVLEPAVLRARLLVNALGQVAVPLCSAHIFSIPNPPYPGDQALVYVGQVRNCPIP